MTVDWEDGRDGGGDVGPCWESGVKAETEQDGEGLTEATV